ncbi:hypothetical protein JKF63_05078 [Porcisia hertigi]|uniref:Uncharacterized protein n=1 Tax=Porcisia hertigi TaxID=2761500 RepID=A0A836IHP0_9TRYP|nr:hypothetical protein JKF63_05078 [Porcisia hertigi]
MLNLSKASVLSVRRCCPSVLQGVWRASAASGHRRWRSTAAVYSSLRTATAPAARQADPHLKMPSYLAPALTSDNCPTAAVLVHASGTALITLPYCLVDVQERVRACLRSVLLELLLAPLLTEPLVDLCGEQSTDDSSAARMDRSGTTAAITSTVVHRVTRSPSTLRYLAFSHQDPRLRHPSWASLWAARLSSSTLSTAPCAPHTGPCVDLKAAANRPDGAAADPLDVHVQLVDQVGVKALVQPCLGEVAPLLGYDECGSFLSVTTTTTPKTTSETHKSIATAAALSATSGAPSPSLLPFSPAVTYWECCRVDSYIPPYVQVQAAVRHLLRRRRPSVNFTANALSAVPAACTSLPQRSPARPLAVIAVVAPDHLTTVYSEFVDIIARERTQQQQQGHAACGSSVHLLLFNSRELVRECAAV